MKLLFGLRPLQSRSKRKSAGACVNFIIEPDGEDYTLVTRPGLTKKKEVDSGYIRACKSFGGKLYVITGDDFYELDTSYNKTKMGNLYTSGGRVSMSYDGTYVVIVDGTKVYTYNTSTQVFAVNTDADILSNPTHVVFSDGFHFINDSTTGQMATHETSYAPNGNWDALDFATAEYAPDKLLSMVADHGNVFLFGEETTEVWEYDPNSQALPLRPIRSATMEYGTCAAYSPIQFDNSVVWLAKDRNGQGVAVRANGWTPQIISTVELHKEWASYTFSDAFSQVWWLEGHPMWLITFPTDDKTWVYDSQSGKWSEFQRWENIVTDRGRHRANESTFFNNKVVCGDYYNGNIYEVDFDTYSDNGDSLVASAESQKVYDAGRRIYHSRIELMFERGVGLTDDANQGHDPQVRLLYSDDDGNSWFDRGWKSIGKKGEYRKRIYWTRLGSSRERIYRIEVSDPVNWVLAGAELYAQ